MRKIIAFVLFTTLALAGCSGQGTLNFNVVLNTPTPHAENTSAPSPTNVSAPARVITATPSAASATSAPQTDEQPPTPGGQETNADKLPPDIVVIIQTQLAGQNVAGAPRVFVIPETATQVESQYMQQLSMHGWQAVSNSVSQNGNAKVMVIQKGKIKAHIIIASQTNAQTVVYILTTKG